MNIWRNQRGLSVVAGLILGSILIVFAIMAAAQFLDIGQTTLTAIDSKVSDGSLFTNTT